MFKNNRINKLITVSAQKLSKCCLFTHNRDFFAYFVRAAERQGVILKSAEEFVLRHARAPHAVRLAVNGQVDVARYEAGVVQVRQLLDNPREEFTV